MAGNVQSKSEAEVVEEEKVEIHHQGIGENLTEKQECQNLIDCARENDIDVPNILKWNEFLNTHQCERFMTDLDFNKNLDQSSICFVDEDLEEPLAQLVQKLQTPEVFVPEEIAPEVIISAPPAPEIPIPVVETAPVEPEIPIPVKESTPVVEPPPPAEPVEESAPVVEPPPPAEPEIPTPVVESAPVVEPPPPAEPEIPTPVVEIAPVEAETPVETEPTPTIKKEEPFNAETAFLACQNMVNNNPDRGPEYFQRLQSFREKGCLNDTKLSDGKTIMQRLFEEEEKEEEDPLTACKNMVDKYPNESVEFFKLQPLFKGQGCLEYIPQLFPLTQKDQLADEEKIIGQQIQEDYNLLSKCGKIVADNPGEGKGFFEIQPLFKGMGCNDESIMNQLFPVEIQNDQSQEEKIEVEDIQTVVEDGTPPEEFAQKLEACKSIINNQRYVGKGKAFFVDQIIFKGEECETFADGKIMDILFPAR